MKNNPIGIFDSGIGGLTVAKEVANILPKESIIYLGDTARVPYGTRGKKIIAQFALELANFLIKQKVKFLVIACNTISATCFKEIKKVSPVPVLGVITPAAEKIIRTTKTGKVGVIGTRATVNSKVYEQEIWKINPRIKVFTKACPLFVPIAEEGLGENGIATLTAEEYLSCFKDSGIDTLHLGCTHYPLLKGVIQKAIGNKVTIIDSAQPSAEKLKETLEEMDLLSNSAETVYKFYVTDSPDQLYKVAKLFFGKNIKKNISNVSLGN